MEYRLILFQQMQIYFRLSYLKVLLANFMQLWLWMKNFQHSMLYLI